MRIIILYHSAAGSTKYIANAMNECLKKDYETVILPIEECDKDIIDTFDRIILGFPTFHGEPSSSIIKFIRAISKKEIKIPTYLSTTCGLYSTNSLRHMAQACNSSNLLIVGSCSFRCPASDGVLLLPNCKALYRFEKDLNKKLIRSVEEIIQLFNKSSHIVKIPRWKCYSVLNYLNKLAGQYLYKPSIHINDKLCIACKKCLRGCANQCFIYSYEKIVYQIKNCEHCYRCIHHCPKGALSLKKDGCTKKQLNERFFQDIN